MSACLRSVVIAHPRSPELYSETSAISALQQSNQRCEIQNLTSSYPGQSTFSLLLDSLTFLFTFASSTCFYMSQHAASETLKLRKETNLIRYLGPCLLS